MAIALLTHTHATGSTFTTPSIDTTGATLLVASQSGFSANGVLTDSLGNTWVVQPTLGSSTQGTVYYCINPTVGATHTFTITGGSVGSLQVASFSGVTGVLPFDTQAGATGTGTTGQPGSVTPANVNSLIVCGLAFQNAGTLSSIDSGFTITDTDPASGIIGGSLAYIIETSVVAKNPTWTFSASLVWATRQMVFIEGTATPPTNSALLANVAGSFTGTGVTTAAIDTSGATLLIANVTGVTIGTLTDSKGNTWTGLTQRGSGSVQQRLFYAKNPSVGSGHTFTIASGSAGTVEVAAFSNIDTTAPFDVEAGSAVTGAANQYGAVTPSQTYSLIVSGLAFQNNGASVTGVDQGLKITDTKPASSVIGGSLSYIIQQSVAAFNPKWTLTVSDLTAADNAVFITVAPSTTIQIPLATMAITGLAPAVTRVVPVPVGALAITGYAPTIGQVTNLPIPVGTLALATFAPAITISIPVPLATLALTGYAPIASLINIAVPLATLVLTKYAPLVVQTFSIAVPKATLAFTTYAPRVQQVNIGACAERYGPKLYYWEPSYLVRPEDTILRATDWENGGHQGLKFVQGLVLEADTEGQTRQIKIQGDQLDIETISINHNGQIMKPYSLNQPVQKHLLRLLPLDLTAHWRLFNVRWVFEPAPEFAGEWKTQGTDHDIPGYQFLKDGYIAHCSTVDITLNITVDDNVFTYTIPHGSGQYIKSYILFAIPSSGLSLKGKLFTYELTSSVPFQLFQKDCEVRVHAWAGGDYMVKLPFGDVHRTAGARI